MKACFGNITEVKQMVELNPGLLEETQEQTPNQREPNYFALPVSWAQHNLRQLIGAKSELKSQKEQIEKLKNTITFFETLPCDMFHAVENENLERIQELVKEKPGELERTFESLIFDSENRCSEKWHTPLIRAVMWNKEKSVELLLELGADASVTSPEGEGLVDLAVKKKHKGVLGLLKKWVKQTAFE